MKSPYESILEEAGFEQSPWDKCPQGFEKSDYPCYTLKGHNVWVEIYKTDPIPYGRLNDKFFDTANELKKLLKQFSI